MPFPPDVREEALLAAARHCCVCRRYKGVKVEVHHIIPESEGGQNTPDNAVVLCFDCHTDAGHYNPNHPRGTRYSRSGLHRARDEWQTRVAQGGVPTPTEPDRLYCRYFLCRDMEILKELTALDLSRIPVEQPFLVRNGVFDFWQETLSGYEGTARHERLWGDCFQDEDSYLQGHPDAEVLDTSAGGIHYFRARRRLSREEATSRVASQDHITDLLLRSELPVGRITQAVAYWELCGDDRLQEIYLVRPLWFAILAATNITDHPLHVTGLDAVTLLGGVQDLRPFVISPGQDSARLPLPAAALPRGATALIPVGTLLPDYRHGSPELLSASSNEIEHARIQKVAHCVYGPSDIDEFLSWGPRLWPFSIGVQGNGEESHQKVHALDPTNVYTLDRYWQMGCCPHLFFRVGASLQYGGQLFARGPSVFGTELIRVPPGVFELEVVELEEETTEIHAVRGAAKHLPCPVVLRKGESVRFRVAPSSVVELVGRYLPATPGIKLRPDPWRRNSLVCDWIAGRGRVSGGAGLAA